MMAFAREVGSLFHRFALRTAILIAARHRTATRRVSALVIFREIRIHDVFLFREIPERRRKQESGLALITGSANCTLSCAPVDIRDVPDLRPSQGADDLTLKHG
jgi:hypothetical protein